MKKEKNKDTGKVEEPEVAYEKAMDKTVRFFSSYEEENEYVAKQRAALSYEERMTYIEDLRKKVFNSYLMPDGRWKPIEKIFKIMSPYTN